MSSDSPLYSLSHLRRIRVFVAEALAEISQPSAEYDSRAVHRATNPSSIPRDQTEQDEHDESAQIPISPQQSEDLR